MRFSSFIADFKLVFVDSERYMLVLEGLLVTLEITFFAVLIGIGLGTLVASIRSTYDKNEEALKKQGGLSFYVLFVANTICKIYLTVIRGTPTVVQLLIAYFIIFASSTSDVQVAILAFGINSGAYVAEIIRAGIMSVDNGQFEAGRSLGFNYVQTMLYIIIPQMVKNVLPALCNEFIVLIKETSIAGYIGIMDLTKAGDLIRGRTFSAYLPLLGVAFIYLMLVLILTHLVGQLERRLRVNER
ncbi:MAG: amino acid ABC transporter permease [Lachnospiraceae bacterium]|nr:amino acid ABC transporter permease [Lachnospiraceae bacterium]MBQ1640959.1 amino acid ABC transporter permease [Lachnospiraceae bacterium]MBQ2317924.1 amino acid ABC transporter permease [Lachnospiraceae bacterium]